MDEKYKNPDSFTLMDFKSDLDSTRPNAMTKPFNRDVLILWPDIPPCDKRTLDDICGGDPDFARRFMALCGMHLEMRVNELVTTAGEEPIRTGIESGGGLASAKTACNEMLRSLKLRHQIAASEDGKVYPVALDGKDARLLREDWLRLADDDLTVDANRVRYSSEFFSVLHDLYAGGTERRQKLLKLAKAAQHYALAMREMRRMPKDMKQQPGGAAGVRATFEAEARKFCVHWLAAGHLHKGYGFHLWASCATLFEKWGCMELIAQTAMEGTVGKLGRIMPRIKLHAAGRYSEDTLAGGEEDRQRELAKRRAGVRSTEQAVYDELCMESWNAEYEFLPCRKRTHNHQYTMREVHKLLDRAIHEGRVMAYEDYRTYWQRYMGYTMAWCFLKGRAKVLGSREAVAGLRHSAMRRTYGAELLAEYHRYYQRFPMRKPGEAVDTLRDAQAQRWRKADYRERIRVARAALE